jgi:tetrahydromethanopterin S-methyltransferase subunit G
LPQHKTKNLSEVKENNMELFEQDLHSKSLSTAEFEKLLKSLEKLESKLEFKGHFNREEKIVAFRKMEEFVFGEGIGNIDSKRALKVCHAMFFLLFRNDMNVSEPSSENKFHLFGTKEYFAWQASIACNSTDKEDYSKAIIRLNELSKKEKHWLHMSILKPSTPPRSTNIYELLPISRLSNHSCLFYSEKINDKEYTLHLFVKYSLAKSL